MNWLKRLLGSEDNQQGYIVTYTGRGEGREVRSQGSKVISPDGPPSGEEIIDALKADLEERGMPVDEIDIRSIRRAEAGE